MTSLAGFTTVHKILFGSSTAIAEQLKISPWNLNFVTKQDEEAYKDFIGKSRFKVWFKRAWFESILVLLSFAMMYFTSTNKLQCLLSCLFLVPGTILLIIGSILGKDRVSKKWNMFCHLYIFDVNISSACFYICLHYFEPTHLILGVIYFVVTIFNVDFILNFQVNSALCFISTGSALLCHLILRYAFVPQSFTTEELFFMCSGLTSSLVLRYQNEIFSRIGFRLIQNKRTRRDSELGQVPAKELLTEQSDMLQTESQRSHSQPVELKLSSSQILWRRWENFDLIQFLLKSFTNKQMEEEFKTYASVRIQGSMNVPTIMGTFMALSLTMSRAYSNLSNHMPVSVPEIIWLMVWLVITWGTFFLTKLKLTLNYRQWVILISFLSRAILIFLFHFLFTKQNIWRDFLSLILLCLSVLGFRFHFFILFQQTCLGLMIAIQIVFGKEYSKILYVVLVMVYLWVSYIMLSISSSLEKRFRAFFVSRDVVSRMNSAQI